MVKSIKRTSYSPVPFHTIVPRSMKVWRFIFDGSWTKDGKRWTKRFVNRYMRRKAKQNLLGNI